MLISISALLKKLFIFFFLSLGLTLYGTTYYVSTDGNDSNPGTFSSPWLTWQKAFNVAVAGDIVNIRGGVYYTAGILRSSVITGVYVNGKNGTASNRITIQAYQNEVPILDCSSMTGNAERLGISFSNCSYYTLTNLTVTGVSKIILPTNSTGLATGTLWNDAGAIRIKP